MKTNVKRPPVREHRGAQEVLFAAGGGTDDRLPRLPLARPVLIVTRGRIEYAVRCPGCDGWHRHVHLGSAIAPCGQRYDVRPRSGATRKAAA